MKKIIIVGGGTAGIYLAKKFAPHFNVLVIESSNKDKMPLFYRIPLSIGFLFSSENKEYLKKISLHFNKFRKFLIFYQMSSMVHLKLTEQFMLLEVKKLGKIYLKVFILVLMI